MTPSPYLNVKQSTLGASWRMVLTEVGWPTALPAATQPTPPCTHLRNVGYNSAFTRHTIWNARVIPIRPTQATTILNQCRSGEETHRGHREQVRTVPVELPSELEGPERLSYLTPPLWIRKLSPEMFRDLMMTHEGRPRWAEGRMCFSNLSSASRQRWDLANALLLLLLFFLIN